VSNGDFRRAILKGINLNDNVLVITNKNFLSYNIDYDKSKIHDLIINSTYQNIPILDKGELVKIINEKSLLQNKEAVKIEFPTIDIPVVIMAGGKGSRMEPFTKILPKPLIPIGEKTILEMIMNEFEKYKVSKFYLSVNHKANMIKAYLDNINQYDVEYLYEDKPLGTAGSLKLLKNKIDKPFFVSNCDIIIKDNYKNIYDFHIEGNYQITLVASMQYYKIPYGICEFKNGGDLIKITEKPEYDFLVNTGLYLVNPSALDTIPEKKFYHITTLINDLLEKGEKVGVFPVSKKSWIDVGEWDEYRKSISLLKCMI
ncbi:MAG: nucleotidyltransferase family protein, partial [Bacteroidetes bacterium]|nr:nucleotidyltransferase family protein [Bacteroidota bacterium]